MNEAAIRERIKRMLANGQLPRHGANQIAAAYGDGTPCDICAAATSRSIVTYELRFGSAHHVRSILMHFACYELWESERTSEPASEDP